MSGIAEQEIKRLNINLELGLHNAFKAATAARGKNMTDEILKFIEDYVARHRYDTRKDTKKKGRR